MLRDRTVVRWKKVLVIASIVYLFLPVDLIPPMLIPFGFIDDLILWIIITNVFSDNLDGYYNIRKPDGDLSKKFDKDKTVNDVDFEVYDDSEDE